MSRIRELYWTDASLKHLSERDITPDDIDEIIFGIDDEGTPPTLVIRDGANYVFYGQTGSGRLLLVVGEPLEDGILRPFAARDMADDEKRRYRTKGK